MAYDPRYIKGFEYFNRQDYFEAHEVWEELWHDTHDRSRDFIQGLIQVTSAFHHFSNKNLKGARILHDSGIELLEPYGHHYMGVHVEGLLQRFKESFKEIKEAPQDLLPGRGRPGKVDVPFSPDRIFKIDIPS